MKWKILALVVGLLLLGVILVACGATSEPCPECPICPECPTAVSQVCPTAESVTCPTAEACPECPEAAACPTAEACPECPEAAECPETAEGVAACPFGDQWSGSAHADTAAEAFNHWNESDPPEVPTSCARCHSEPGYLDYLGADGTAAGVVDQAASIGTVIDCKVCHNDAAIALDVVTFPSGITVTVDGPQARCMVCHQGRASTQTVNDAITAAGLTDDDTVSPDLGFTNIHYFAAAATRYGGLVEGGYQYEGKAYDGKFDHVAGVDNCIGCHNQHTLEIRIEVCATCHTGVASVEDLKDVRMAGSTPDYNGNGNVTEGIYYEIAGLQEMTLKAIQAYAEEVSQTPIVYDASAYPYFFIDTNGNGSVDEGEAVSDNGYNAWTGRLAKAAYNYQTSIKDPGAFAHGGKYIIELLYDSIESLNEKISNPIDLSNAHRIDAGHFASSEEAFRHWDEEGEVSGSCARCHSAQGLPLYIEQGVNIAEPPSGGLNCATCHNDLTTFTRYSVEEVTFPSGAQVSLPLADSNLCLECHQGRESTVSMNRLLEGLDDDAESDSLRFLNVHYFAAGATLFGTEVKGAYEYSGKEYVGRNTHVEQYSNCTQCHLTHGLTVKADECKVCHTNVQTMADLTSIRMSTTDYDGDGNTTEGIAGEIDTMREDLATAMNDYATQTVSTGISYNGDRYPYFFDDAGESFSTWTPRLLRAAYNYQYSVKDPGAFAHNSKYVIQFLYDSLEDLGWDVSGMTRP
jgi:hypothetical protein